MWFPRNTREYVMSIDTRNTKQNLIDYKKNVKEIMMNLNHIKMKKKSWNLIKEVINKKKSSRNIWYIYH